MAFCKKFCLLSAAVLAVFLSYAAHSVFQVPLVPKLDRNQWWGLGDAVKTLDTSIRPFRVEFKPERLTNLKQKLSPNDWFTEPLEGIGFQYGFNSKYLKEIANFWRTKYDFTEREKYLNKYPQFKTNIQGLDIHFIHIKQKPMKHVRVIPLLLLHGWPGSFVEFYKLIPLLTIPREGQNFVFDIVVPSLPGYGYSQAAAKPGLGYSQTAVIMHNLMRRLRYDNYMIQGGDWGSIITMAMAVLFPESIYGYHTNMPVAQTKLGTLKVILGSLYPPMVVDEEHISKIYPLTKTFHYLIRESGYLHLQSTKPDTIGIALKDSPIGLAAYILEKFSTWTNPDWISLQDGGLTKKHSLTEMLDNIMVYWDSGCITTSMRLYSESFNTAHQNLGFDELPVTVPTAVARFAHELYYTTRCQIKNKYLHIVQLSDFENGGHFAAFEEPQLLADDILSAVTEFDYFNEINNRSFSLANDR